MNTKRLIAVAAVAASAMALPSWADDPEVPAVEPDVWAEVTYDDIPAEVTTRSGALIPLDAVSYIQSGLVGHFDAIRNAGLNLPHSSSTRTWKNLVSGYPDASFNTSNGRWLDDGFYFTGDVHAIVNSPGIDVAGQFMSIQIATTVDWNAQSSGSGWYAIFFGNQNNDTDIYFNNSRKNNTLIFNADTHGTTSNRPQLSWDGRYATAILGDGVSYLVQNTTLTDGRTRTNKTIPARQFTWGGQQNNSKYYVKGTFHAVRIYAKALVDSEIAWNRMLDEVRYRGADTNVNVIVESNVAGVEATEVSGKYMVNGQHVFTAPASVTANGCVYAPSGYSLEVWDAAANCWSAAEAHDGETSFAYTNCLARAKVRIIWNWTLQSGVKKYDADSYLQGGLLLNYDGIRNVGLAKPHSMSTATWANLGSLGASQDAVRGSVSGNAQGEWSEKGYVFKGANYFTAGGTADFGQRITAQVVTDSSPTWRNTYKRRWPSPLGCTESDNTFLIYGNNNGYLNNTYHFRAVHMNDNARQIGSWNGRFFNAIISTNTLWFSDGETTQSDSAGTFVKNADELTMVVGSSKADDNYAARCFAGRIHAARWYNRVLTEAEIKYNNDIDWCRFFGATGRSEETDLIEVRSGHPEIVLDDDGVYIVRGSGNTLTVSAPATTNIGNHAYACTGYCIETWDSSASTWTTPVQTAGTTCVLTGTTGGANRRVTWLWTLSAQGFRAASDYDVSDYVQTGLVGHFDGIRNEGADMPHGNQRTSLWRNLATDGPDAVISSSSGVWTDGFGFQFNGSATGENAKMKTPISFGADSTVEIVCNVDYSVQSSGSGWYPAVFSDESNNYCVFFRNTSAGTLSRGMEMNADGYGTAYGRRPIVNPWNGQYLTAVLGSGSSWIFQGTTFENQQTRSTVAPLTKRYAWGGCPLTTFNSGLKGVINSVRLYNRVLTEAELAHNRRIDDIRYKGVGDVTVVNGAIGNTATTGASSVADGVYNLDSGTVTVTAPVVREEGHTYRPRLLVETYNAASGEWIANTAKPVWSESYTVDKTELGDSRIRLTWTWKINRGMMIIVK